MQIYSSRIWSKLSSLPLTSTNEVSFLVTSSWYTRSSTSISSTITTRTSSCLIDSIVPLPSSSSSSATVFLYWLCLVFRTNKSEPTHHYHCCSSQQQSRIRIFPSPICCCCCCRIRSVLLFLFQFPVPFVFFVVVEFDSYYSFRSGFFSCSSFRLLLTLLLEVLLLFVYRGWSSPQNK